MASVSQLILSLLVVVGLTACDNSASTDKLSSEPDQASTTEPNAENLEPQTPAAISPDTSVTEVVAKPVKKEPRPKVIDPIKKLPKTAFKVIEWTDLMPAEDLEALLNPPSYIADVEDGSFEDQISSQVQSALMAATDDRYQQALVSHRVIEEMDGQPIRIPGFIVPLEFDDNQTITQFFLVPFFGACIHLPPPPPNQIIFVDYPEGLQLDVLYDPFWISGILKTSIIQNETASAAYSLRMQYVEEFEQ